jgi:hypothetical protein
MYVSFLLVLYLLLCLLFSSLNGIGEGLHACADMSLAFLFHLLYTNNTFITPKFIVLSMSDLNFIIIP